MVVKKCVGTFGLLFVGIFVPFLMSGCRLGPRSEEDAAYVRLINAVPDAGDLTVSVEGKRVWKETAFGRSTGYQGITAGAYPVRLASTALGESLTARSLSFKKGHEYTVLALAGNAGRSAQMLVWEDKSQERRDPGKAAVRLVNAAPGLRSIDLVINNIVGLKAMAYGKRSQLLTLEANSYDLKIVAADTSDSLMPPIHLRLESGRSYLLVAMGQASTRTLTLEVYPGAR